MSNQLEYKRGPRDFLGQRFDIVKCYHCDMEFEAMEIDDFSDTCVKCQNSKDGIWDET